MDAHNDLAIRVRAKLRFVPKATLTLDVVTLLRIESSSPAQSTQFERPKIWRWPLGSRHGSSGVPFENT
jgi:hypothetical protein